MSIEKPTQKKIGRTHPHTGAGKELKSCKNIYFKVFTILVVSVAKGKVRAKISALDQIV